MTLLINYMQIKVCVYWWKTKLLPVLKLSETLKATTCYGWNSVCWITYSFKLGAVYLPCESSENNKVDIFEVINEDIDTFNHPVFLLGDFYSRTGLWMTCSITITSVYWNVWAVWWWNGWWLYHMFNADFQRVNKDPEVNTTGRALIELCQIQNRKYFEW